MMINILKPAYLTKRMVMSWDALSFVSWWYRLTFEAFMVRRRSYVSEITAVADKPEFRHR